LLPNVLQLQGRTLLFQPREIELKICNKCIHILFNSFSEPTENNIEGNELEEYKEDEEYEYENEERGTELEYQKYSQENIEKETKQIPSKISHDDTILPTLKKNNTGKGIEEEMQQQNLPKEAEELTPQHEKLAEPFLPILGRELCKKIFSKHWNLREEGLKTLIIEVPKDSKSKEINYRDPWEGFVTIMGVVSLTLIDRVNQVSTQAIYLLKTILTKKLTNIGTKNELTTYIEIILNALFEKIADTNPRVREMGEDALMSMVRNPVITCNAYLGVILKDNVNSKGRSLQSGKQIAGKLKILQRIVREFKIDNNEVPYSPIVAYGVEKLENPNAEIRSAAVSFLAEIYALVGDRLMESLDGVRQAHMEVLKKEFVNVSKRQAVMAQNTKNNTNSKNDKSNKKDKDKKGKK